MNYVALFLFGFLFGILMCLVALRLVFSITIRDLSARFRQKKGSGSDEEGPAKTIQMKPSLTYEKINEDRFLKKIWDIVIGHLGTEDLDIESLARKMHLSRSQLFRKIKLKTGSSPSYFVRLIRLLKAREQLLNAPEMNISQVAYSVGFKDTTYFSKSFSRVFGLPPRDLRQQRLAGNR